MTSPSLYGEFRCPECGSNWFRTDHHHADAEDASKWVGQCKGCGFEWPRSEDAKYFDDRRSMSWQQNRALLLALAKDRLRELSMMAQYMGLTWDESRRQLDAAILAAESER